MIEGFDSREQSPLGKDMLVGNPKLGWYLVQLFSTVFVQVSHEKREELYSLLDSENGRSAFSCIMSSLDRIHEDKKSWNNNSWNKKYNQEKLLKAKLGFLDMLPESFGSYERSKVSVALDSLFPGEKGATVVQEITSTKKGVMARIRGLVGVSA